MKKQINSRIKAHLVRSAVYVLLLVAVCVIPFALAQRNVNKQNVTRSAAGAIPRTQAVFANHRAHSTAGINGPAGVCQYTITGGTDSLVPGDTDIGSNCDDCDTMIALPFSFQLYDMNFSTLNVSSNGRLDFVCANESGGYESQCLPPGDVKCPFDYTIFGMWTDLMTSSDSAGCANFPGGTCGVFTSVTGTAPNRIFNIEWRAVYFNDPNQTANFEVRLYENDPDRRFDVIYGSIQAGSDQLYVAGAEQNTSNFTEDFCDANPPAPGSRTYTCAAGGTPTPTPTPSATASPSGTPSASPSATGTPTVTPSATPSASASPTTTPSATPSPTETPSGTPTVTPSVTPTATATPGGCVRGQGYWKTHPEAWPVTELQLGNVTYNQQQLLDILHEPVHGNGLLILAHQLIAAKLNIAAGADASCIQDAIADADALIGDLVIPPIGDGYLSPRDAAPLAGILGEFNEGFMCAPACETGPGPTGTPTPRGRPTSAPRPR